MRYEIGQKVWVMFAHVTNSRAYPMRVPYTPWNYGPVIPKVDLIELTVTEHHKVRWDYDNPEDEAKYDGYLLTDEKGGVWANQYPHASYSQTSTAADQAFNRYFADEESEDAKIVMRMFEQKQDFPRDACDPNPPELPIIYEGREMLSELNELYSGIQKTRENGGDEDADKLNEFYETIIAAFMEKTGLMVTVKPLEYKAHGETKVLPGHYRHAYGEMDLVPIE